MSEIRVDTISEKTSANGVAIDSVTLKDGGATLTDNITFSASGKGVHLGVTTATASNLLDDYEEGTYAYTITGSNSGSLSARSGYARGVYTKIGNWVKVDLRFETDADNSIDGNLRWSLPFTAADRDWETTTV